MRGRVVADGSEAVLPLRIFDPGQAGRQVDIQAVIDTGFTGHLTLTVELVSSLALPELGLEELLLADGSTEIASVHRATVEWHGRSRTVPALAVGGEPLIGMALLAGSRFEMDTVPGGEVLIEDRPA
jgi:clan AA aspartic protease